MEVREGYRLTEVGEIPEDWSLDQLGESFVFKNGLNKEKEFFGHGTPIVNYMDVYKHNGLTIKNVIGKVEVTQNEKLAYQVKIGDVFFTRTSETMDEIGISAVVLEEMKDTVYSGFILRARSKNDKYDLTFKQYAFLSSFVRQQIMSTSSYTTRALTNGRLLSNVYIPLPPKPEQQSIAQTLSDTDALIDALEKLIEKKRHIKQGAMQELLTGKRRLPGFEVKKGYKQTELGEIPEDWKVVTIGEIAITATGSTPPTSDTNNYGDKYLFVSPVDISTKKYINKTEKMLSAQGFNISRRFPANSILFVSIGSTIGKCALAPVELTSNQQINAVFPSENISSNFLYYMITFVSPRIKAQAGEQAVPIVNKTQFSNTKISICGYEEQKAIASVLSDMDNEIEALEHKQQKTREIKDGMMHELLTGRIRLI